MKRVKETEVKVGDVLRYPSAYGGYNSFYLVCETYRPEPEQSKYFVMSLKGRKNHRIKYYNSLEELLKGRGDCTVFNESVMELTLNDYVKNYAIHLV